MKKITAEELKKILEDHRHYLRRDCAAWQDKRANFSFMNLSYMDLSGVDLREADLAHADLAHANLTGARLSNANITNAHFNAANLRFADLNDVIGRSTEYITGKILTESIIGYKKCIDEIYNEVIVALEIPKGAIVFSINGTKCRTNRAKVIDIQGSDRAYSTHKYMSYYPGDEFDIKNFNCMYNIECAEGIHFFTDKHAAECYCG